jgi:hypothetical protein
LCSRLQHTDGLVRGGNGKGGRTCAEMAMGTNAWVHGRLRSARSLAAASGWVTVTHTRGHARMRARDAQRCACNATSGHRPKQGWRASLMCMRMAHHARARARCQPSAQRQQRAQPTRHAERRVGFACRPCHGSTRRMHVVLKASTTVVAAALRSAASCSRVSASAQAWRSGRSDELRRSSCTLELRCVAGKRMRCATASRYVCAREVGENSGPRDRCASSSRSSRASKVFSEAAASARGAGASAKCASSRLLSVTPAPRSECRERSAVAAASSSAVGSSSPAQRGTRRSDTSERRTSTFSTRAQRAMNSDTVIEGSTPPSATYCASFLSVGRTQSVQCCAVCDPFVRARAEHATGSAAPMLHTCGASSDMAAQRERSCSVPELSAVFACMQQRPASAADTG